MEGCIITGFDGRIWGSQMLYSSSGELKPVLEGFTSEGCKKLKEQGAKLNGNPFWIVSCDDEVIRGVRGKHGFTAYNMKQSVLIGTWDSKLSHGQATQRVERMGEYIKTFQSGERQQH